MVVWRRRGKISRIAAYTLSMAVVLKMYGHLSLSSVTLLVGSCTHETAINSQEIGCEDSTRNDL